MRAVFLAIASLMLVGGCSDSPQGSADRGKKPSLSKGAEEFMKVYGGVESGVGEAKPEDKKDAPGEKK